jgi:hypothetical protein
MANSGGPYPFAKQNVDVSPAQAGVYALYDGKGIIYFGRAQGGSVTIRSRLQSHLAGREGACTKGAAHYWYEVCSNPVTRERELLEWFKNKFKRLPGCNEVMP